VYKDEAYAWGYSLKEKLKTENLTLVQFIWVWVKLIDDYVVEHLSLKLAVLNHRIILLRPGLVEML
jgi:hypothetical protein